MRGDGCEPAELRVVVAGEYLRAGVFDRAFPDHAGHQPVDPAGGAGFVRERKTGRCGKFQRGVQVREFFVPNPRGLSDGGGCDGGASARLVIPIAGADAGDEVTARGRVVPQEAEFVVCRDIEAGHHEHGMRLREGRRIGTELARVHDARLSPRVDHAAVERIENDLVRLPVGQPIRAVQRGEELERPLAVVGIEQRHVGVGLEPVERRADVREEGTDLAHFGIHATRPLVVRNHSAPVGLRAEVQRVPVPILDHGRPPRDKCEGRLLELAGIGRVVLIASGDRLGVGLSHQEAFLLRGEDAVGLAKQRPDPRGRPVRDRLEVDALREVLLHAVIRVARRHVEGEHQVGVILCRPRVGDTGRDELVGSAVFAHDIGLPGNELGGEVGLITTPGQVVLRERIAVGNPQLGPLGDAVRPVGEPPLAIECLDIAILFTQPVDEGGEGERIMEKLHPRLVVDLESDHRRM